MEGVCIFHELQFRGASVQKALDAILSSRREKNISTFVLRKLYYPSLTAPTIPTFGIMVTLTWYNMARLPSSGSPCVELALILQGMMDFSSETVQALQSLLLLLSCTLASFPYWMRIVGALLCGD